jgi:hypothetical protein
MAGGLRMGGSVPRTGTCAAYTTTKATIFIYQQPSTTRSGHRDDGDER